MPKLNVIACSTRPSRNGLPIAQWFHSFAQKHGGFESELIDLAELNLPVFDEPEHPRLQKYQHEHTKKWSSIVANADAFVFVLPEYNFGPPPSFVNAIDYLSREWHYKPAGFVSYGGMSGGVRAVQGAKLLLTTMKVVPMLEAVTIPNFAQHISADKQFVATTVHEEAATTMLNEMIRWARALAPLRA
mgnify:CR=1 FL=1